VIARFPDRISFSPVRIGGLEIKNRVAMTAMGVNLAAAGGGVSDDIIAFYEARARGGLGLMVSEICRVMDGAGAGEPCQLAARNGADVPGLGRLADTVHKYGARMFIQLHHPGRQGSVLVGGEQPVSASAVANPHTGEAPRPLTLPEIGQIQEAFVNGARLAQMAGADGVELHGAHGYLINSFLSPYLNRRGDQYGGSFENRLRFLLEILGGIRAACGQRFPLGVRLSAEEFLERPGERPRPDLQDRRANWRRPAPTSSTSAAPSRTAPGSPPASSRARSSRGGKNTWRLRLRST
jgi:2,4-dienoyl-CoA reductase-like NADH-dependent reductase (Old Yellow Enzyme family)